jgi:hypothetical protein
MSFDNYPKMVRFGLTLNTYNIYKENQELKFKLKAVSIKPKE